MAFDFTTNIGIKMPLDGDAAEDYGILLRQAMQTLDACFGMPQPWEVPPVILGEISNPTCSYAFQNGYVLRAGTRVEIDGAIGLSAISGNGGGPSNYAALSLPFTVANFTQFYSTVSVSQLAGYTPSLPNPISVALRPIIGTKRARLVISNGTSAIDEACSALGAGFFIRFSGRYFTNDPL